MALFGFSLSTLQHLDGGRAQIAWDLAVKRAIADCKDRPAEPKPREVTLKLKLVPVIDQAGEFSSTKGTFHIQGKAPEQITRDYSLGVNDEGRPFFNDGALDNHQQRTFDEDRPEAWDNQTPPSQEGNDTPS